MATTNVSTYQFGRPLPRAISDAIEHTLSIENEDAKSAGRLGFMARGLTQATMPYKDPNVPFFERKNGNITLSIVSGSGKVPSGRYPRLLLSWLCTEAVRTRDREIVLGDSLGNFLASLDIKAGKSNAIFLDQMTRLFTSLITIKNEASDNLFRVENIQLVKSLQVDKTEAKNLWLPNEGEDLKKWNSKVVLTSEFFEEIITSPVPIDLLAYKKLKSSPMAMDAYCWLTYRMSFLRKRTEPIPWVMLQSQFGSGYNQNQTGAFKNRFIQALQAVEEIYRAANIQATDSGLILSPSRPHISFDQKSLFS